MEDYNGEARYEAHCLADVVARAGMLPMWTIYEHPRDFPEHFVVRMHVADASGSRPAPYAVLCASLPEAREQVPCYCVQMQRDPNDDPAIVELWI